MTSSPMKWKKTRKGKDPTHDNAVPITQPTKRHDILDYS